MTVLLVGLAGPSAERLRAELDLEGVTARIVSPDAALPLPPGTEAAIVPATRTVITAELVAACDRAGVRIIALGDRESRMRSRFGLRTPLPEDAAGWEVAAALGAENNGAARASQTSPHRVTVVWGPQGAPGRSTIAIQLAMEFARRGRRTALADADTVAPSLAILLGLSDESPGIAAACRRAELGALDPEELTRLSAVLETSAGEIEVLSGINRPTRWPELSEGRLRATLRVCREWAQECVVDVGAAFDADDEATFDLSGPRRHAATAVALSEADLVIAVAAADPLGISRFLRDHAELQRRTAQAPTVVVVNQVRPGPLGVDARTQIRRTLDRFAGITDVAFLPHDQRATDAALLHARPIADVAPRSALVAAVRRVASGLTAEVAATDDSSRGSFRAARRLRRARAVPGG